MKIMNKMTLAFLLVVFIPTAFVGVFLTSRFRQAALENATLEVNNSVSRISKLTSDILKVPDDISSYLLFDTKLEELVNTKYDSVLSTVHAYNNYIDIKQYLQIYSSQISNIRLYIYNPTLLDNWCYIQPDESIKNTFWYKNAMDAIRFSLWYYIGDETKNDKKYLSLVRRIRFTSYNTNGILVISLDRDYLSSMLSQEPFQVFIVDDNENIVATNQSDYLGKALYDNSFTAVLSEKGDGTFDRVIGGKSYRIVVEELKSVSSINGLKIISVFSIDNLVAQGNQILVQGLIIILLSALASGILIYIVSYLLSKRIMRLSRHIRQVTRGDLDTKFIISGNDEAGQLSSQFNSMIESIKQLISEVNESNIQKSQLQLKQNELRLKMMASQIDPHFLFNALESIRMKALLNGEKDVSQIIRVLGKLMRKKLEIQSKVTPLKNELDMVRCYLEIEKYRYDERLEYELVIEPESEEITISALLIQPLVENAVHHGLASANGKCLVSVKTQILDNELHVWVADNGEGMSEEKLKNVIMQLDETEKQEDNHIGLNNVNMRIKLTYGGKYGLKITSKLHEGTQIHFSLPVEGGTDNV
ncbi:MAG TPA: sensor histidine kinase [Clostridia bacterium]|nr:sensor histidine kinase [Clostridia bacterium]